MRFATSIFPSLGAALLGAMLLGAPDLPSFGTVVLSDISAQVPVAAPTPVRGLPTNNGANRNGRGSSRGNGARRPSGFNGPKGTGSRGGVSPRGLGSPPPTGVPGGVGTPGGDGGPGGNGGPGGVGTPNGNGGGTGGGTPGGGFGNPGGTAGGPGGGGIPPLPGPTPGQTTRNRRNAVADDDWRNWWRLNELYELALDRRYRSRAEQAEPDRDLFLDATPSPSVKLIEGGRDAVLRLAMPPLQKLVRHKTPRVRAEAVLAMGKVGGDGAVSLIAPFVKEPNLQVRKNAILALGLTKSRRAFPHLRQVLTDARSKDIERAFAAIALGLLEDKRAEKPLRKLIDRRSQPQEVRAAALYALGHLKTTTGRVFLEYFVLRPLEDPRLRAAALQGLAATGRADLGKTVEDLLEDPNVHVRRSAALSFGQLRFVTPYRADLVAMERDFDHTDREDGRSRVREEADAFLGALRLKVEKEERRLAIERDAAVNALARRVREDSDVMVKNFAIVSLGRLGGKEARKVLGEVLGASRLQSQRAFTALAIGLEGDAELSTELRKILERGRLDPKTRGAAAIGLGLAEEERGAAVMMKLLRSSGDVTAIEGAVVGLGLLGHDRATTRLLELAKAKSRPELKRELGIALGLIGHDPAIDILGRRLAKRGPVIGGVAAAEALSGYPDVRALQVVAQALDKKGVKDSVEAAGARAIGILAEKGDTPVSADFFRHLNYLMRFQALNEAAVL